MFVGPIKVAIGYFFIVVSLRAMTASRVGLRHLRRSSVRAGTQQLVAGISTPLLRYNLHPKYIRSDASRQYLHLYGALNT